MKKRIHLIKYGDSLGLSKTVWACREPKEGEEGYFGYDGTLHHITCGKCINSPEYRELCEEQGKEHPYVTRAKKAVQSIRAKGGKVGEVRRRLTLEEYSKMVFTEAGTGEDFDRIFNCFYKTVSREPYNILPIPGNYTMVKGKDGYFYIGNERMTKEQVDTGDINNVVACCPIIKKGRSKK